MSIVRANSLRTSDSSSATDLHRARSSAALALTSAAWARVNAASTRARAAQRPGAQRAGGAPLAVRRSTPGARRGRSANGRAPLAGCPPWPGSGRCAPGGRRTPWRRSGRPRRCPGVRSRAAPGRVDPYLVAVAEKLAAVSEDLFEIGQALLLRELAPRGGVGLVLVVFVDHVSWDASVVVGQSSSIGIGLPMP